MDNSEKSKDSECKPNPECCGDDSNDQQHSHTKNTAECCHQPSDPPTANEPPEYKFSCKCPETPGLETSCLQGFIDQQQKEIVEAESAEKIKEKLIEIQSISANAIQEYTPKRYKELLDLWNIQDGMIIELICQLDCAVKCWKCVLDCHVGPLFHKVRSSRKYLFEDRCRYTVAYDLKDEEYCQQRDLRIRQQKFDRVSEVLDAWCGPDKSLEAFLTETMDDHKSKIEEIRGLISSAPDQAIYELFLYLVPRHLSIAPPPFDGCKTAIGKTYCQYLECTDIKVDRFEGVNVGERCLKEELVGVFPSLKPPVEYLNFVCGLVKCKYLPAQSELTKAKSTLAVIQSKISEREKFLESWKEEFRDDALQSIPDEIHCCDYKLKDPCRR